MRGEPFLQPTSSSAAWSPGWFTATTTVAWSPRELQGLQFWIPTHQLRAMWLPISNATRDTNVSANGQLISQVDETGPSAHAVVAPSGREPTLGSDVGGRSYATFTPNDFLTVSNSLGAVQWLYNGSAFSILVWLRIAPGASTGAVLDSSGETSLGTTGITLQYNGTGTLLFTVARQVAGNAILHTSTASVSSADGWVLVAVTFDGASTANMRVFTDGGTNDQGAESMAVTGGFDSGDATYDLHMGVRGSTHGTGFEGDIGDVILLSNVITESELDELRLWKPPQTNGKTGRVQGTYATLGPAVVSGLSEWHDFGNRATQWQDTVGGTPVANADDPIGVVENSLSATTSIDLKRNFAYDGTAAKRPLSKDAASNGSNRPAALFDGATGTPDDELTIASQTIGGASTWVYVVRNLDSTNGSHLSRAGGNQYLVKTGSEYLAGGGNDMRIVLHTAASLAPNNEIPSFGKSSGNGESMPGGGEVWEIITVRRDGKAWTVRWNGVNGDNTFLNDGAFGMSRMGPSVNPAFELDGYVGCRLRYTRAMSDAEVALVEAGLASEWGITLQNP